MTPETLIKRDIRRYLDSLGDRCWHVPYMTFGYGPSGVPDRLACYRGVFFAPEVKRKKGTAQEHQKRQHAAINAAGGIARVVDDVEQVKAIIREIDLRLAEQEAAYWEDDSV